MNTNAKTCMVLIFLVTAILWVCGCTTTPAIPPPVPVITGTPGLTYEEYLSSHPPPPANVEGTLKGDHIELNWDVPAKVTGPHRWSDTITRYNIYRGRSTADISFFTTTTGRIFRDFNISGSLGYIYKVTAVHDGDVESAPSEHIPVQIPVSNKAGFP
jgi:hypothetical protein